MNRRSALAVFLFLLVPAFAFGGDPMDVDDVLKLLEAGISERVIVAQIEASGSDFDLSTDDIVSLQDEERREVVRILRELTARVGGAYNPGASIELFLNWKNMASAGSLLKRVKKSSPCP